MEEDAEVCWGEMDRKVARDVRRCERSYHFGANWNNTKS